MRTNTLKTRLANGEACRGIWLSLPSVPSARLLARLPCDWLAVDAEHSPLDVPTLIGIMAAMPTRAARRRWCASPPETWRM